MADQGGCLVELSKVDVDDGTGNTAIELIVAAQAVDLRDLGEGLAPALRPVMALVRARSPRIVEDRALGDEIEAIAAALQA